MICVEKLLLNDAVWNLIREKFTGSNTVLRTKLDETKSTFANIAASRRTKLVNIFNTWKCFIKFRASTKISRKKIRWKSFPIRFFIDQQKNLSVRNKSKKFSSCWLATSYETFCDWSILLTDRARKDGFSHWLIGRKRKQTENLWIRKSSNRTRNGRSQNQDQIEIQSSTSKTQSFSRQRSASLGFNVGRQLHGAEKRTTRHFSSLRENLFFFYFSRFTNSKMSTYQLCCCPSISKPTLKFESTIKISTSLFVFFSSNWFFSSSFRLEFQRSYAESFQSQRILSAGFSSSPRILESSRQ